MHALTYTVICTHTHRLRHTHSTYTIQALAHAHTHIPQSSWTMRESVTQVLQTFRVQKPLESVLADAC